MTSFNNPTLGSNWSTEVLQDIMARDVAIAKMDYTGMTEIPVGSLWFERWNNTTHAGRRLLRYDGTSWIAVAHFDTPGQIKMTGRTTAPDGWLLCDGSAVSQTTYADLYAEIGVTFGVGGAGTFKVPDMRQKFPIGKADSGSGSALGTPGGTIDHSHAGASHQHTLSHTHGVQTHYHTVFDGGYMVAAGQSGNTVSANISTYDIDGNYTGAYASYTVRMVGTSGEAMAGGSAHSHTFSQSQHQHTMYTTYAYTGGSGIRRDFNADVPTNDSNEYPQNCNTYGASPNITVTNTNSSHYHGNGTLGCTLTHTHSATTASGTIGLVTGGQNGDASGNQTIAQSATTTAFDGSGAGTTGTNNPPFQAVNFMIKT